MIWSPENQAEVKRRFLEGDSAGVIAAHYLCTRGVIAGGLRRMGLKREGKTRQAREYGADSHNRALKPKTKPALRGSPEHKRRTAAAQARGAAILAADDGPVDATTAGPWITRQLGECARIVQGTGADALACCAPVGHESPKWQYCPACRKLMFVKPEKAGKAYERSLRRQRAA